MYFSPDCAAITPVNPFDSERSELEKIDYQNPSEKPANNSSQIHQMGIPLLHKLLNDRCQTSTFANGHSAIQKKHPLRRLQGQVIAIDTSIYIYKFLLTDQLIEQTTEMITTFKKYDITPVFIFDGRPPPEKKELMQQRYNTKRQAQEEYEKLLQDPTVDPALLARIKGNALRIVTGDMDQVKQICDDNHVRWFQATGEADPLCAYLVNSGKANAVLSEDMDMFAYGCPCILRQFNLQAHTVVKYNMQAILKDLGITSHAHFREILVISGTDYDITNKHNLFEVFDWYKKYQRSHTKFHTFTGWLNQYGYIHGLENVQRCIRMFDSAHFSDRATYAKIRARDLQSQVTTVLGPIIEVI